MLVVILALAVLIGVSLGLLGGGGSIITVPLLVYVAGQEPKAAIATSLLVVGVTSAVGAISHARAGRVQWRTGLVFGAAGMVGAYGGGRLAAFIPGTWLLVAFGMMMAITAAAMLRGRRQLADTTARDGMAIGRMVLDGLVVGMVTGLVGAGGGFLIVPALVLLGGVPMATAVGTSLVVIALKSGAGLLGYLASTPIDWRLALGVTAAAVAGSILGGSFAGRISEDRLRRVFGWFVAATSVVVLGQQLTPGLRTALLQHPATWFVAVTVAIGIVWTRASRHAAVEPDDDPDDMEAAPNTDATDDGDRSHRET